MILDVSCLSGEPLSVSAVFHWVVALWCGLPPGGFEDGVAGLEVTPFFDYSGWVSFFLNLLDA